MWEFFSSFKSNFSKACSKYLGKNPGGVITTDVLVSLVAEAWPNSFTAINVISGFTCKKCGIYPLNPGEVTDRQLALSKAVCQPANNDVSTTSPSRPLFSPEQESLYQQRYQEHYDIKDPGYIAWLRFTTQMRHLAIPEPRPQLSLHRQIRVKFLILQIYVLSDVLVVPKPQAKNRKTDG